MLVQNLLIRCLPPKEKLDLFSIISVDESKIKVYTQSVDDNYRMVFCEFISMDVTWRWARFAQLVSGSIFPNLICKADNLLVVCEFLEQCLVAEHNNQPFLSFAVFMGNDYLLTSDLINAVENYERTQMNKIMAKLDDDTPSVMTFNFDDVPDAFKKWGEDDDDDELYGEINW